MTKYHFYHRPSREWLNLTVINRILCCNTGREYANCKVEGFPESFVFKVETDKLKEGWKV